MRLSTLCILIMVLVLSTGNAWCQETETVALTDATAETVDVAVPPIDVAGYNRHRYRRIWVTCKK